METDIKIPSKGQEPSASLVQEASYIPYEINIDPMLNRVHAPTMANSCVI